MFTSNNHLQIDLGALRKEVDQSAEAVLNELVVKNVAAKRFKLALLEEKANSALSTDPNLHVLKKYMASCHTLCQDLSMFCNKPEVSSCLDKAIQGVVDPAGFLPVKSMWRSYRRVMMVDVKLNSENITRHFVFVESIGRLLLVWHEQQGLENTKKNLRLVDHLLAKYSLNSLLRCHVPAIRLMNLLGEKYDNQNLKNRLKSEYLHNSKTSQQEEHVAEPAGLAPVNPRELAVPTKIEQLQTQETLPRRHNTTSIEISESERTPARLTMYTSMISSIDRLSSIHQLRMRHMTPDDKNCPQELDQDPLPHMDTSFLSEKSGSSISFMGNEDHREMSSLPENNVSIRKRSQPVSPLTFHEKSAEIEETDNKVQVQKDVRELTREKIYFRLLGILGDERSGYVSSNIESRLFGEYWHDEALYDVMYSKVISLLDSLPAKPSLLLLLIDKNFDLNVILSRAESSQTEEATLGKRSVDKTTQTFEFNQRQRHEMSPRSRPSLASLGKGSTTGTPQHHSTVFMESGPSWSNEKEYLQRLIESYRQENEHLKKSFTEFRYDSTRRDQT